MNIVLSSSLVSWNASPAELFLWPLALRSVVGVIVVKHVKTGKMFLIGGRDEFQIRIGTIEKGHVLGKGRAQMETLMKLV